MALHPKIADVTARIEERSRETRRNYLDRIEAARKAGPGRQHLSCGNLAHAFAAVPLGDKLLIRGRAPNIGIVTSYNDMLSAHQPFKDYPDVIKDTARKSGGTAQVAGGTPAMCDGVTQGRPGMELSLFSRDVIALSTAVALTHDAFDAGLMLGTCDKIVPGLVIGALSFGHLPIIFSPAGPMPSGISNKEKAKVREQFALGQVTRETLLEAEAASYHSAGTCTFYGTANSNQMMMELMGLHLPGTAFINPDTPLREALVRAAAARCIDLAKSGESFMAQVVDAKSIVNAIVGLMATPPTTRSTCPRWRRPPASLWTGTTSPTSRPSRHCSPASIRTARRTSTSSTRQAAWPSSRANSSSPVCCTATPSRWPAQVLAPTRRSHG